MEHKQKFIVNIVYYAILICFAYLGVSYALPVLTPFIEAFVIVWLGRIPAKWIAKKTPLPEKPFRVLFVLFFYAIVAVLFLTIGVKIGSAAGGFVSRIPDIYRQDIVPIFNEMFQYVEETISRMELDPVLMTNLENAFSQFIQSMGQWVSQISVSLVRILSNYVAAVPSFFIRTIIMIVSSFFIALDYEKIIWVLGKIMPKKLREGAHTIKEYGGRVLFQYLRSYALIFCITCVELSIGLLILRVPNAIGLAFLIAVIDILPILGLGGVLIPWLIVSFVLGNYGLAIGLLILYLVITVIRNVIEPKIIGKQIGLHPLLTLIGMFVGLRLFGILGLFGIPIAMSILLQLYKEGLIEIPKRKTQPEK